jgi:uncharacterized protein
VTTAATMPMFPLGTVLFPFMLLPLHVFEPRYRQLVHDCLGGEGEFGVVLIERGSEVGGGDVRTSVGSVARILRANELADGRWYLVSVGVRRIRVERWLDDDPYPRAEVVDLEDDAPSAEAGAARASVARLLRRVLALRVELGERAAEATTDLDDDPAVAAYQAAALAPLGPFDSQTLLAASGADERLRLLDRMLAEEAAVLSQQLGGA